MNAGISMECHKCGHEWTYTGGKPEGAYTNCPNTECRYKVRIPEENER